MVRQVELDVERALYETFEKAELTEGERLRVVAKVFGGYVGSVAKYMIREERHPGEPDRPGGLE